MNSFLDMNNAIYDFQFSFRQKYSISHAFIFLSNKIREQLDNGNFACGLFAELQKAFGTVHHEIHIQKFNHYGITLVFVY